MSAFRGGRLVRGDEEALQGLDPALTLARARKVFEQLRREGRTAELLALIDALDTIQVTPAPSDVGVVSSPPEPQNSLRRLRRRIRSTPEHREQRMLAWARSIIARLVTDD
ncbi:hypothetical protein GCM10028772_02890 [Nocardioides ultimimeridianus]